MWFERMRYKLDKFLIRYDFQIVLATIVTLIMLSALITLRIAT